MQGIYTYTPYDFNNRSGASHPGLVDAWFVNAWMYDNITK